MKTVIPSRPAVSVIVPVYNSASTLERCLESLLAQSFTDFEIILVDDGSTDGSADICAGYSRHDSRIKVISQPNRGVSAARNLGLDNASGEYVAFCDSDDMVRPSWLSSMMAAAGKAGLVVCGYNIYRNDTGEWEQKTLGHTEIFTDDDVLLETLLSCSLLQFVWNKLFNMKIIRESGLRFEESFTVFEDEYFVLGYIMNIGKVICIPECTYDYWHPADFMKKYDFGIDSFKAVVERIYAIVKNVQGHLRLPSIVYWYKIALGRYVSTHSYEESKDYLLFARRLAISFHDGPLNHLTVRFLPPGLLYLLLKAVHH